MKNKFVSVTNIVILVGALISLRFTFLQEFAFATFLIFLFIFLPFLIYQYRAKHEYELIWKRMQFPTIASVVFIYYYSYYNYTPFLGILPLIFLFSALIILKPFNKFYLKLLFFMIFWLCGYYIETKIICSTYIVHVTGDPFIILFPSTLMFGIYYLLDRSSITNITFEVISDKQLYFRHLLYAAILYVCIQIILYLRPMMFSFEDAINVFKGLNFIDYYYSIKFYQILLIEILDVVMVLILLKLCKKVLIPFLIVWFYYAIKIILAIIFIVLI